MASRESLNEVLNHPLSSVEQKSKATEALALLDAQESATASQAWVTLKGVYRYISGTGTATRPFEIDVVGERAAVLISKHGDNAGARAYRENFLANLTSGQQGLKQEWFGEVRWLGDATIEAKVFSAF